MTEHQWDATGERCTVCGDKDWMGGMCSGKAVASDAYPPLPKHMHTAGYLAKSPALYTAEQMRAYVDADRATRPTLQSLGGDAGVSEAMVDAYLQANDAYWKRTDQLPTPPDKWRTGTPREATRESLRAALSLSSTEKSDGWGALSSIRHLVADDAHACTFQSFGQYRTALLKAIDALSSYGSTGWKPLATAPEGVRVLLGPREAPVVGKVVHGDEERGSMASVVHYNGNTLVAGYRCSEWHHLPAAPKAAEKSGRSE